MFFYPTSRLTKAPLHLEAAALRSSVSDALPHQVADGLGFMLAGLWSLWRPAHDAEPVLTCAIVTRDAPAPVSDVHPRMPVILRPEAWLRWIDPRGVDADVASALLAEHAVLDVKMWEVSRAVNRPGNDGPDLLLPIPVY